MLKRVSLALVAFAAFGLVVACSPPDREDSGGPGSIPRVDAAPGTPFPDARPVTGRADAPPFVERPDGGGGGGGGGGIPGECATELDCPAPDDCCFIFLEPPGACLPGTVDPILGCFPDLEGF